LQRDGQGHESARQPGGVDQDQGHALDAESVGGSGRRDAFPLDSHEHLEGDSVASRVLRTGQPARIDADWAPAGAIAETARSIGVRADVGVPVFVEGRLWGAITTGSAHDKPLPPDAEGRLDKFTKLMATAIANAEARAEVHRLADEQAALRRVATLVARERPAGEVLAVGAEEVTRLFDLQSTLITRSEPDGTATAVGAVDSSVPIGTRMTLEDDGATSRVYRTGRPARFDTYSAVGGWFADQAQRSDIELVVAVPIVVDGHLWGVLAAGWRERGGLPANIESRLGEFAELLATAISSALSSPPLARASLLPPTTSAAGSSAICTTARSSAWSTR
jgi:GAF domain-containing protein